MKARHTMKRLVICEKPSVARAVAIGLGVGMGGGRPFVSDEWIIEAARGHLLQLAYPEGYDPALERWAAEDLPFIPESFRWEPREESADLLEHLIELIRSPEVGEVVNACDAGREGELIFKLIFRAAEADKPVRRAWFSSLTPGAVRRAFEALRDDSEMRGLEEAALTRDIGDWLIGINGTRAATVRAAANAGPDEPNRTVSVGRVQTPSLRILVEREREIDTYVPIPFYRVAGTLEIAGAGHTLSTLMVDDEDEPVHFETSDEAEREASELEGRPAALESHEVEEVERAAPLPFDLATLQVEASRAFGWSAARTLREAQRLYEKQFISYPRTDSRFLTWDLKGQVIDALARVPEALPELADEAARLARAADEGTLSSRPFNAALVRDHHAIIPTSKSGAGELKESAAMMYGLIARRFVAAFMPPSREERHRLRARVGERVFGASGWRLLEPGWRTVERGREPTDPEVLAALEAFGASREEGRLAEAASEQRHPRRPRPHTDGSLIRAMERAGEKVEPEAESEAGAVSPDEEDESGAGNSPGSESDDDGERHIGIGTPATRSGIIETLIARRYARRYRSWIYVTARGRRLIEVLDDLELTSPELTADWERRLDLIREGEESRERFQKELEELTRRTVAAILSRPMEQLFAPRPAVGPCPRCGGQIVEGDRAFGCDSWRSAEEPGCGWVVYRETTTGRVGRAEAAWRIAEDRPHGRGQAVPLAPREADPAGMPEEMEPYEEAEESPDPLPDPDDEGAAVEAAAAWAQAIEEVLDVEGPVMTQRVLRVLRPRAAGLSDRQAKRAVNRATAALVREERIEEVDDDRTPKGQQDKVLRLPGQAAVRMRTRGPRDPLEVSQREVRAAWEALGSPEGDEGLLALARAYAIEETRFAGKYREWFEAALGVTVE
jgi:DNA topoisomerase III